MSNANRLDLIESMKIEEIMSNLSKLKVRDSNQRVLAEAFIDYMRRVGNICDIEWCSEKYVSILEGKLKKYKRFDRQIFRKIRRRQHFHPINELKPMRDLIWAISIQTDLFAVILKDLLDILKIALENIENLKNTDDYISLRSDSSWLNDCMNYLVLHLR